MPMNGEMTAQARRNEPLPLWAALALLDLAILVPAFIAQVWWRSSGMCSDDGFSCDLAGVYLAAPAVLVGMFVVGGSHLRGVKPMPRKAMTTILLAMAALQVFNAVPIDGTLNDGCNTMTGRTVRALKLDRGPFTDAGVPLLDPDEVMDVGCTYGAAHTPRWVWGDLPAGNLGG